MERRIVEFIAALRASGVRISLAESADAFRAVEWLGVTDRETFRLTLRATLVKDAQDFPTFERLFPMFFQNSDPPPLQNILEGLSESEAKMLAEALRAFNLRLREMLERLLEGKPLSSQDFQELDNWFNPSHFTDLRYQNYLARQLENALQFPELRQSIQELVELLQQLGMNRQRVAQIQKALEENRRALQEQIRQFAGQQILQNMAENPPQKGNASLVDRLFQNLTEAETRQLREEVRRMAAALRTRLALRLRRAKDGQFDPKATIRANLQHGSIPIELRHRDHTLKPKLVILCDLSTSMRYCVEFFLTFISMVRDQIRKSHSFAYIDHLEYISPDFERMAPNQVIQQVLRRMPPGYYNTDLGNALESFAAGYMDLLDHRTILIVLGDGRNNFNPPREDLFQKMAKRARTCVWLNPDPLALWGTGDSDMPRYLPFCDLAFQVSNLRQLSDAVDHLLCHPVRGG
ncbi:MULTISPECIES: VWA domain-containing protein [Anaerolinea]|uniref:vWA domain-containing protein n=1 Tax=Anaerolinea TaxID=233189 RepID=UPI00262D175C|nr:VWA domain-containing protein [Anaerolinea thermophila]